MKRALFLQTGPKLGNQFEEDKFLQNLLKRSIPQEVYSRIEGDLKRFGQYVVEKVQHMGDNAEANPPRIEQFDSWGKRVDRLHTAEGWRQMQDVAAKEGLVAIGYERNYQEFSRIYQFAKLYLFVPWSAVYGCPLAMTDGAARLIELHGDATLKGEPYKRLTSRDPQMFWTSGQWMTERTGGSDVSRTETIAEKEGDEWSISGFKWFSSATEANMTMLLARAVEKDGSTTPGSKGLSLFFAKIRNEDGLLNGIRVQKLKNKLGTKALPTAELELDGLKGTMVGEKGRGVANISTILNITRIHNAISASGYMRRSVNTSRDFARKREVQGKKLSEMALHLETLAIMEVETRVATELAFYVVGLLGKSELKKSTDEDEQMLRLLTPVVKLFTAKQSIGVTSEGMECLGGQGYIEDTGMPRLFRDAQVGAIWEGTTNVLSLDVLRVLSVSPQCLSTFEKVVNSKLKAGNSIQELKSSIQVVSESLTTLVSYSQKSLKEKTFERNAREISLGMGRIFGAALLIDGAVFTKDEVSIACVKRWCSHPLFSPPVVSLESQEVAGLAMCLSKL